MAGKLKGITIEIGGDVTPLEKSLSAAKSKTNSLSKELRQVEKLLKFDPSNTELLAQKQDLLKKRVEAAKEETELLKQAQEQIEGVDLPEEQYRAFQREVATAEQRVKRFGDAEKDAGNDAENAATDIKKVGDAAEDSSKEALNLGDVLKANLASQAIIGGVKALYNGVKQLGTAMAGAISQTAESGDRIDKMSQKLNVSRTEYQQLDYALQMYAVDVDSLQNSLKTMSKAAQNNADCFTALGLSQEFVKSASTEELFEVTIKQLQGMSEGTDRTAIATEVFGKAATDLLPLLNDTNDNFQAIKKQAPLMADETVTASAVMQDTITDLQTSVTTMKDNFIGAALPSITEGIKKLKTSMTTGKVKDALEKIGKTVGDLAAKGIELAAKVLPKFADGLEFCLRNAKPLAVTAAALLVALKGFSIVSAVTTALKGATTAQLGLNAAMAANPIGLVLTAVVALVAALGLLYTAITSATSESYKLSDAQKQLVDDCAETKNAYDRMKESFEDSVSATTAQYNNLEDLSEQLFSLCDETGKVDEANQGMAEYIIGTLNDALGTEYTIVDGQIQKYDELKESIYDTIEAKRASVLLEQSDAAYADALSGQAKAYSEIADAQADYNQALINQNKARAEYEKWDAFIRDAVENSKAVTIAQAQAAVASKDALENANSAVADTAKAWGDAKKSYSGYTETIAQISEAQALALEGDLQGAIDAITGRRSVSQEYIDIYSLETRATKEELEKQANNATTYAEIIKRNYENGVSGYTKDMVDEAQAAADDAVAKIKAADWESAGENAGEGLKRGMENKYGTVYNAAVALADNALKGITNTMQIKSPARVTKYYGRMAGEGLEVGLEDSKAGVAASAENVAAEALASLRQVPENVPETKETAINIQSDNSGVIRVMKSVIAEIRNLKLYLDGDKVVGGIIDSVDTGLAGRYENQIRGAI